MYGVTCGIMMKFSLAINLSPACHDTNGSGIRKEGRAKSPRETWKRRYRFPWNLILVSWHLFHLSFESVTTIFAIFLQVHKSRGEYPCGRSVSRGDLSIEARALVCEIYCLTSHRSERGTSARARVVEHRLMFFFFSSFFFYRRDMIRRRSRNRRCR